MNALARCTAQAGAGLVSHSLATRYIPADFPFCIPTSQFGDVDNTAHGTLDQMAALFNKGSLKINVGAVPGVQRAYTFDEAAAAYTVVAAGNVLGVTKSTYLC